MFRFTIALMCVLALALTACEQEQVTETPQVEEGSTASQPTAEPGQETAMQEPPPAGTTGQDQMAMQEQEQEQTASQEPMSEDQSMAAQEPSEQQMAGQQSSEQQMAAQEPGQQQEGSAAAPSDSQEHMGQSPEFGDAPENITLEAKNGNVEFSHSAHADMMECQTCHGAAEPGPIEGWDKNMAHDLCKNCHQEKGAGPTKCTECHKK